MSLKDRLLDSGRRVKPLTAVVMAGLGAFALWLVILALTGRTWRAIAYATVALFAFLILEAIYFWGTMVFGGMASLVQRRRTPVPWELETPIPADAPEHALDPGLEVLAAGMLVYQWGAVKPQVFFRDVALTSARAVRPFIVARTGMPRLVQFDFGLHDESDRVRFQDEFVAEVRHSARLIMPPYRLQLEAPHQLVGQRWQLQVRSGVTVITTLSIVFLAVAGEESLTMGRQSSNGIEQAAFERWVNEALKEDVLRSTQDVMLEGN